MGWPGEVRSNVKKYRDKYRKEVPRITKKVLGKMSTRQLEKLRDDINLELIERGSTPLK